MPIRRIHLVLGLVLAAMLAVTLLPWQLAEKSIERLVLARLSKDLGLSVTSGRDGAFAVLPVPRIIAYDVRMDVADGGLTVRIPRMRSDIRLLALLGGRIEFDHIFLMAPEIHVTLPGATPDLAALAMWRVPATLRSTPRITVQDGGTLFLRDGMMITSSVRQVQLDISERDKGDAFEIRGDAFWRGEAVSFAIATASELGRKRPELSLRSGPAVLTYQSAAARQEEPRGKVDLSVPSISRLANWLGGNSAALMPAINAGLSGTVAINEAGITLAGANVVLGSNTLEGSLELRRAASVPWALTGTLAGDLLQLDQLDTGQLSPLSAPRGNIASQPINVSDLFGQDIDLRLSLRRVRFGGAQLTDVASQIMVGGNRAELSITNAEFYRGVARSRLQLVRGPEGVQVRQQLSADRVDFGHLSGQMFEGRRLTGTGALAMQIEAYGQTIGELASTATGRFSLAARAGDVAGANLPEILRRLERQPLAVLQNWRGGRTAFDQLSISGLVTNGSIEFNDATMSGPGYRVEARATARLPTISIEGTGQLDSARAGINVPFALRGPLHDLRIYPDVAGIILRSRAAAPLTGRPPIEN